MITQICRNFANKVKQMPIDQLTYSASAKQKALNHLESIGFKVIPSQVPHSLCIQRSQLGSTLTLYSHPTMSMFFVPQSSKDYLPEQYITEILGVIHKAESKIGLMLHIATTHKSTNVMTTHISNNIEEDLKVLIDKGNAPERNDRMSVMRFSSVLQQCFSNYVSMLGVNDNVLLSFNDVLFNNYVMLCKDWVQGLSDLIV